MADESDSAADGIELNIARRTRSHVRVDDCVLNDCLDGPDVDKSLYPDPNSEGDEEYKKFLAQCFGNTDIGGDTNTDDNDPVYVFNDDCFSHGWRFNLDEELASFEELQAVPQQANEILPDDKPCSDQSTFERFGSTVPSGSNTVELKSPSKYHRRRIEMFDDPEFARVLNQQLRQHIQLLTQTYLLTRNTTNMRGEAEEAKAHLDSYMKVFKNKSKPSNLLPAMELVNDTTIRDVRSSIRLTWRPLAISDSIKRIFDENPNVFMYRNLMPQVAFSIIPDKLAQNRKNAKPRINFTMNEDRLLAYALHEFKSETSQYAFIASLLMTAKTKTQISNHIKNIKRSPGNEENPIKLYFSHGVLPRIDLDSDAELRNVSSLIDKTETVNGDYIRNDEPGSTITLEQLQENEPCLEQSQRDSENNHVDQEPEHETENHAVRGHSSPLQNEASQQASQLLFGSKLNPQEGNQISYRDQDEIMNMDLDDLMAASTTISKSAITNLGNIGVGGHNGSTSNGLTSNGNNNNEVRNMKNLMLKESMLNLMSHKFLFSQDMGDLIIYDFLKTAQTNLSERNYLHLLQLLTDLMKNEAQKTDNNSSVFVYEQISKFLLKINAPLELQEKVVLFLDLEQATKSGCAFSYLHWMRFFEFMQHVEIHHDGEALEKKLVRLIDALQRDDPNKVRLATTNLVNKHPLLKREFESLALDGKPHSSLFVCEEDFDDITEPMSKYVEGESYCGTGVSSDLTNQRDLAGTFAYEHFNYKVTQEEANYASQSCPCSCHADTKFTVNSTNGNQISIQEANTAAIQIGQHCGKCNLKFMRGRMYLVNKIKPILAEWSYTNSSSKDESPVKNSNDSSNHVINNMDAIEPQTEPPRPQNLIPAHPQILLQPPTPPPQLPSQPMQPAAPMIPLDWTFEEDKEILEFCRAKAEQNEETISFDTNTFEELVKRRKQYDDDPPSYPGPCKRSAHEIAERFNQLMGMYKDENSNATL